jgi:hypothetical protein
MGSRGRPNIGSLLHSLTPRVIRHGFAPDRVTPRVLALFGTTTADAAEYLEHTTAHSYLSHSPEAAFFRRLAGAVPEIVDVLCTVNTACTDDIDARRRGLAFLSSAVAHMAEADAPALHAAIRECDVGPLGCYLATKACEEARRDFGTMFAGLVEGLVPADFEFVSLQAAAVLQVRARARKRGSNARAPTHETRPHMRTRAHTGAHAHRRTQARTRIGTHRRARA